MHVVLHSQSEKLFAKSTMVLSIDPGPGDALLLVAVSRTLHR